MDVAARNALLEAWRTGDTSGVYVMFIGILDNVDCDTALASLPEDTRHHLVEQLEAHDGDFAKVASSASARATARIRAWNDQRGVRVYEAVVPFVDRDDLHEILAARGPDLLAQDVPYIIRACRWKGLDRTRRRYREQELPEDEVLASIEDAFEALVADRRLVQLRSALAQLQNMDLVIVWKTAEGDQDSKIAETLKVSIDVVRQRRSRAVNRLRELMEKIGEKSPG